MTCPSAELTADELHWALVPPMRIPAPETGDPAWCLTPIDAFVLARLEERGLSPSPAEGRRRIIRRLTMDVTGLPPTYVEVCEFLEDTSPDAYEKLVDRLLANPHSGEQLAQLWLDIVRYADSDGFEYDTDRPSAWRYRDWVIAAFNSDMPYDQFVREQIAGDEIAPGDLQKMIPTGLHRLGPVRENAGNQDLERNRQERLVEMTDAIGSAFLGLTIGCAKCHDHKFDPISQEDYYSLQAFFAATIPADVPTASQAAAAVHQQRLEDWNSKVEQLQQRIAEIEKRYSATGLADTATPGPGELSKLKSRLEALQAKKPPPLDTIMAIREMEHDMPPTFVLVRGEPGQHGVEVPPRFPDSLSNLTSRPLLRSAVDAPEKRRQALGEWLTAEDHPLTARVMVNRLWQQHFGRGLVATPNNFGLMGQPPSHQELLDWLASEFIRCGWSIRHIQRLIVRSATYRQSSLLREDGQRADPQNVLLWRAPTRRLSAEMVRDGVLAVSGQLNRASGGRGVRLPLPDEIAALLYKGNWEPTPSPPEQVRRSIYRCVKRNLQPPLFTAFDAPDTLVSCARRSQSTHAGQALVLMNSPFIEQQAAHLARRILKDVGPDEDVPSCVFRAYESVLSRRPNESEARLGIEFVSDQMQAIGEESKLPRMRSLELSIGDFCLVLLNLDEFLFY